MPFRVSNIPTLQTSLINFYIFLPYLDLHKVGNFIQIQDRQFFTILWNTFIEICKKWPMMAPLFNIKNQLNFTQYVFINVAYIDCTFCRDCVKRYIGKIKNTLHRGMIGSRSRFTGNFIRIDLNANWTFTGQSDFHNMSIRMQLIVITKCTKKCFGFLTHNTVILSRSRCFKQISLIRDFVCQDRLCHLLVVLFNR